MDKGFQPSIGSLISHYNQNRTSFSKSFKVAKLQTKIEEVSQTLGDNVRLSLEREQKLDGLLDKSHQVRQNSMIFKKKTTQTLKRDMRWRNWKTSILLVAFILMILYTIVTVRCGIRFEFCRASESP